MAWKNFSKVLGSASAEPLSATTAKVKQVIIAPKRGNSHVIYVGGSGVTATNGLELNFPAGAGSDLDKQPLTGDYGNGLDLASLYVIGTTGEGVQGAYEEF